MATVKANTKIWREQGGATETFESGAVLNLKTGAQFQVNGVDISSSLFDLEGLAEELEVLADMTTAGGAMMTALTAAAQLALLTNATAAEIESRCDDSAMVQTIAAAGALSTSVAVSKLALVGAGAVTLAAPTKPAMTKIIKMTTDNGDVTLALTNVVGGSAATTATFNDVGDTLALVSDDVSGKWIVTAEVGVVLT